MKILFTTICTLLLYVGVHGQVLLKLDVDKSVNTVSVSAVPQTTFDYPKELLGSIQVTFSVPRSQQFDLGTIFSGIPNMTWMKNNYLDDESYSADRVYYTVGIQPIGKGIILKENQEQELFSIVSENVEGIALLGKEDTIIGKVAAEMSIDIANNITIANTMGIRNVYTGNLGEKNLRISEQVLELEINEVYPNPASDQVRVSWKGADLSEPTESLTLQFVEVGTQLTRLVEELPTASSSSSITVDLKDLNPGNYIIQINGSDAVRSNGVLFNKRD